jgi:FAD:protein FMN transferase
MRRTRSCSHALLVLAATAGALSSSHAQSRHEMTEVHMGVRVRLVIHGDEAQASRAARAAFDRIAQLDDKMSDYRPESEIRRLAKLPTRWVPVGDDLFEVLAVAREIACASEGAYDPTIGPLVALWRAARRQGRLPAPYARDSAQSLVGWRMLELDTTRKRVRLARAGMQLDLGGIAKGFIVQQALETMRTRGVSRAMVEAGGDIAVGEAPPGRRGWHVAIPGARGEVARRAAALTNVVVSTSGPTEQFATIDGARYSHVVDARTGRALTSPTTVTVIAKEGAIADALATALTILEPEKRGALLRRYPAAFVFVRASNGKP